MNILLDTHMAIWALLDSPKLTPKARQLITDPDNTIYYSVVSVWEVLLKHSGHPDNMDDSPTISPFFVRGYPKMVDFAIF